MSRPLFVVQMEQLDAVRVELGMSQRELSERAGCEPDRFNRILRKDMDPHLSTVRAFVDVLNEAAERGEADDPVTRTGPKPRRSRLADDTNWDEYDELWAKLDHGPVDAVGGDPSAPPAGGGE